MTSVAQPSGGGGGGGGGGGTGFLFGNIDKRGRLDEDYMDEDAKDAIDNVAPTVTGGDRDLKEITNALPGRRPAAGGDEEEDYDEEEEDAADKNDGKVDYYNEQDELRDDGIDDDAQRNRMASIALAPGVAKKADADDDENYDDDDDAPAPSKPIIPAPVAPDAPGAPSASGAGPSTAQTDSNPEDEALALQNQLISDAKSGRLAQNAQLIDDSNLPPLRFMQIFAEPEKRLDMTKAKPRWYGVRQRPGEAPRLGTVEDDHVALDRPPPVPRFDQVSYFLAQDRVNIATAQALARAEEGGGMDEEVMEVEAEKDASDDELASRPLDATAEVIVAAGGEEAMHVPVEQVAWEDNIVWGDDGGDSAEDDDAEDVMEVDSAQPGGAEAKKVAAAVESDSDDDDWGEDVEMGEALKPVAPAPPAPSFRSAPSPLKVPLSKPLASKPPAVPLSHPTPPIRSVPASTPAPSKPPASGKAGGKKAASGKGKKDAASKDKKVSFAKDVDAAKAAENAKTAGPPVIPVQDRPTSAFINQILRPNRDLVSGAWVNDVLWDSGSSDTEGDKQPVRAGRFSKLILDMNDPNMIFEHIDSPGIEHASPTHPNASAAGASKLLPSSDPFNISNDRYYSTGSTTNQLKVDRRSLLRGLHNAPPAVKCQTTKSVVPEENLLSWHRPKIGRGFVTAAPVEVLPFRRKRPKGGSAQIAGQVPKKRSELYCSSKDAYRVALVEYALEKTPCIMPIPGTASRILTYSRKKSAEAAAQALKNAAGTPEADTVFLAPEQPPPLHAGDIEVDGPPLSVLESHIFAAPCVRQPVPTTDFLVMRRGGKMHVREIDSVISIGVTEPKLEVMAPNTDRFKKYAKDRVSLFIIREFMKQQKKDAQPGVPRSMPTIEKESIFREFTRRRTYPETSLVKMLKELARYQNGKYTLMSEPAKGFGARETELLRTVTAEETSAFEAMESGWETLISSGIRIFTHPTSQGNIIQAGERTGLEAGPAVGAFVKNQLLQSPWYRSQVITAAQKAQKKEMLLSLSLARIVNDLREGGEVMESRLLSLSAGDLQNVLINHFRILARKVPDDTEERRKLVREYTLKRTKGSEPMDYANIIKTVITKHRNQGARGGGASGAQSAQGGAALVIPLEVQREALVDGIVDKLPTELKRTHADEVNGAAALVSSGEAAFGKKRPSSSQHRGNQHNRPASKKARVSKKPGATAPAPVRSKDADEAAELQKLAKSSAVAGPARASAAKPPLRPAGEAKAAATPKKDAGAGSAGGKKTVIKKRPSRIKVTKKEVGADGKKVERVRFITDPDEIEKMMAQKEKKAGDGEAPKVKISIGIAKLSKGGKAGVKKKVGSSSGAGERKKGSKKEGGADDESKPSASVRKVGKEAGPIGKIRISTKQMKKEKEEAAQKRLKNQYAEEDDFRARKNTKGGVTSRKKRNGLIPLNSILEKIEAAVRLTQGYISAYNPMTITRLRPGERPPAGVTPSLLATIGGLDFTQPVDVKKVPRYGELVKKPVDLGMMRNKCRKMQYQSAQAYLDDMELLVKNARAFNTSADVQWVVQHAELLCEVAKEQVRDKEGEIRVAEEAIARMKKEEGNKKEGEGEGRKKKSKKRGSSSSKSGGSRKKQKTDAVKEGPAGGGDLEVLTPLKPTAKGAGGGSKGAGASSSAGGEAAIPVSKP